MQLTRHHVHLSLPQRVRAQARSIDTLPLVGGACDDEPAAIASPSLAASIAATFIAAACIAVAAPLLLPPLLLPAPAAPAAPAAGTAPAVPAVSYANSISGLLQRSVQQGGAA